MSRLTKLVTYLVAILMHQKEEKLGRKRVTYWILKLDMTLKVDLVKAQRTPRVHHLREQRNSKQIQSLKIVARIHIQEEQPVRRLRLQLTQQPQQINIKVLQEDNEIDKVMLAFL